MRAARASARAVFAVCVLVGLGIVGWALRPAPDAPVPSRTFDLRSSAPGRSTATPRAAAAAQAPVLSPARLRIPSLGVDAPVSRESVSPAGELVIPGDPRAVGWWHAGISRDGAAPTRGTLVLAGHVDSHGDLGALHPLAQIVAGAEIVLEDETGHEERWRVDALELRRKSDLPPLPATGHRRLAIVTCGGPVIDTGAGHSYRDNVIAWASPGR